MAVVVTAGVAEVAVEMEVVETVVAEVVGVE